MNKNLILILFLAFSTSYSEKNCKPRDKRKVRVILTSALIDKHFNERKAEYIKSLNKTTDVLSALGYEPYIIESCRDNPTFLNEYSSDVFYAKVNKPNFNPRNTNKGIYEAKSLIKFFENYKFNDDDMIIKLTGRYYFADDYFIKLVEKNTDADAIARIWRKPGEAWTGCFAMKCKYFKDMLAKLNFNKMQNKWIEFEKELQKYIDKLKKKGGKVIFIDKVHVFANNYGSRLPYKPNNYIYW